jgi:hypothetical protein
MRVSVALTVLLSLAPAVCVAATLADRDAYFMNEAEEIRLARTAGPASVTTEASVYALRASGYELAERGEGAFHCFVERSWGAPDPENRITFDPRIHAPHCINAEGARTIMREDFLVARLALEGLSSDEINRRVDAALASGELHSPSGMAMTYMMSKHQWLGEGQSAWKPHVMLWSPGLTREEVGGGNDAFLVGKPGSHRACLVVAVSKFLG